MSKLEKEVYLNFEDVLIKPSLSNINSRRDVKLFSDFSDYKEYMKNWKPFPLMSANMDTVTGIDMAFELVKRNWIAVLHKYVSLEEITELFDKIDKYNDSNENKIDYRNLFISRGTSKIDKEKLLDRLKMENRIKSVCIDVANGYRKEVFEYVKELKETLCKDKILMVGNVATFDAILEYSKIDIDIIKMGIGPGSVCKTRVETGIGVPQIGMILKIQEAKEKLLSINKTKIIQSQILKNVEKIKTPKKINNKTKVLSEKEENDLLKENHKLNKILICSDGGCKVTGDIAKAFAAGSNFVMIGGILAGHTESPGELENLSDGKKIKRFSGMASKESQWEGIAKHGVAEGKTVFIPYKGKVKHTIENIEGGIRSTCTYTNSENITELVKNSKLIQVTVQENKKYN